MAAIRYISLALALFISFPAAAPAQSVSLASEDARWIAGMIFQNECSLKNDCLVTWNEGEDFLSLGIGHFIWYPAGRVDRYRESFPDLVRDLEKRGKVIPYWLKNWIQTGPPWKTRREFIAAQKGPEAERLRAFLNETMSSQAWFMIRRFQAGLMQMAQTLPENGRAAFLEKVIALTATRNGLYALIDYMNFKGDGLSAEERYHTHGWGLLQVLNEMNPPSGTDGVEAEFVEAARKVLRRRVDNAPSERSEERWIAGWEKRVETYSAPASSPALKPEANPVVLSEVEPVEILNLRDLAV